MYSELNPYIEHGKKSDNIKKITVSVPLEIYNTIQEEKQRRVNNRMRHATASELLCEAFAHAFTGQPLPTDEELYRYVSKAKQENIQLERAKTKDSRINNALIIAENYANFKDFRAIISHIISNREKSENEKTIDIFRLINLLTTFVIYKSMSQYALHKEAQDLFESIEKPNYYSQFKEFIDYNAKTTNRNALIAREISKIISQSR